MQLDIAPRVKDALGEGRPVVALETTVITHGMDYPDNVETALTMEETILTEGACPATLGVVEGTVVVGLTTDHIQRFGKADKDKVVKCSRRDLPGVIALSRDGSLTVAGTMMVAHAAGIRVAATGGIGGVHRNHPFDVSADLLELGRTPVAVVCAGPKSILDLPLTMEVLETQGVPVVGVETRTLPAFYTRDSGLPLPVSAETLHEASRILAAWRQLDTENGILFVAPVPTSSALEDSDAESAITQAVQEADAHGIGGNLVTPFVLRRVVELTGGRSLAANKALLLNNARTAAIIARDAIQHLHG